MKAARLAVIPTLPLLLALPLLACGDNSSAPPPAPSTSASSLSVAEAIPSFEERLAQYHWTTIKISEPITFSEDTDVRTWLAESGWAGQGIEGPVRLMFNANVSILDGVTLKSDVPLFVSTPAALTLGSGSVLTGAADMFVQVGKIILPPKDGDRQGPYVGPGGYHLRTITGDDGAGGAQGQSAVCSPFQAPQAGGDGSSGGPGPKGADAANLYVWVADVIPYLSRPTGVTLTAYGQPGAPGGMGGPGGNGGDGSDCTIFKISGARGGRGAVGGRGGDGGKAGNITIYYWYKEKDLVDRYVATSNAGGAPGPGGAPGLGGLGGQPDGVAGAPGAAGSAGTGGTNGKVDKVMVATNQCCVPPDVIPRSP
jgi:hypothetical protein